LFFCLFFVRLWISQWRKKLARSVKFCMRVGLLSGQVFPPFGEHWLAGSHGGGGISRYKLSVPCWPLATPAAWVSGHWELRAVALLKAVWWGMRLASLLTHLFLCVLVFLGYCYFMLSVLVQLIAWEDHP